ncbi:MAG: hypothetical protein AAF791_01080 [Bacteroidota bacterium]
MSVVSRLGVLVVVFALASCAPSRSDSIRVDRVEIPLGAMDDSVLTPERLLLTGSAAWDWTTVAELVRRHAVTGEERVRAEEVLQSGAYLGDSARVLVLSRPGIEEGLADAGTAYLQSAFPSDAAPGPFETDITFELDGPDGATTSLALELRDPDASSTEGGVGQLLVTWSYTALSPDVRTDSVRLHVLTRPPGGQYESVAAHRFAPRDWRGSHRLSLVYAPGRLSFSLNGEPVMTAPVRLTRPAGPVYLGSYSRTPTLGLTLVDWTFRAR